MKLYEREEMLINQGIERGIEAFILDNLEEKVPEARIIEKLKRRFQLQENEARSFFDEYARAEKNSLKLK